MILQQKKDLGYSSSERRVHPQLRLKLELLSLLVTHPYPETDEVYITAYKLQLKIFELNIDIAELDI